MSEAGQPYTTRDLWQVVEGALRAAGKEPTALTTADTSALDHFHTGGLAATRSLLELVEPVTGRRILDLGSGIGGASRFLAERTDASVTSLDFSFEFCAVNARLTRATGLRDRVEVVTGDGMALPFRAGTFDMVWMQQAGMNIGDKPALHGEISRVLRGGGRFAFQEIVAGTSPGVLDLPVPWAATQDDNHLESGLSMRERLGSLGFREESFEDVTPTLVPGMRDRVRDIATNGPPILGAHVLSTAEPRLIYQHILSNTEAGRIAFVRGVFQRT